MAGHAENKSPLYSAGIAARLTCIAWADNIVLVAHSAQEMEEMLREVTTVLRSHDLPCVVKWTRLWAA